MPASWPPPIEIGDRPAGRWLDQERSQPYSGAENELRVRRLVSACARTKGGQPTTVESIGAYLQIGELELIESETELAKIFQLGMNLGHSFEGFSL